MRGISQCGNSLSGIVFPTEAIALEQIVEKEFLIVHRLKENVPKIRTHRFGISTNIVQNIKGAVLHATTSLFPCDVEDTIVTGSPRSGTT